MSLCRETPYHHYTIAERPFLCTRFLVTVITSFIPEASIPYFTGLGIGQTTLMNNNDNTTILR